MARSDMRKSIAHPFWPTLFTPEPTGWHFHWFEKHSYPSLMAVLLPFKSYLLYYKAIELKKILSAFEYSIEIKVLKIIFILSMKMQFAFTFLNCFNLIFPNKHLQLEKTAATRSSTKNENFKSSSLSMHFQLGWNTLFRISKVQIIIRFNYREFYLYIYTRECQLPFQLRVWDSLKQMKMLKFMYTMWLCPVNQKKKKS